MKINVTYISDMTKLHLGAFTNYVDKFLPFFDLTYVDIFYFINIDIKSTFWTTYPPLLVNVVCERPLWSFGVVQSNLVIRNFLVVPKLFINTNCSLTPISTKVPYRPYRVSIAF